MRIKGHLWSPFPALSCSRCEVILWCSSAPLSLWESIFREIPQKRQSTGRGVNPQNIFLPPLTPPSLSHLLCRETLRGPTWEVWWEKMKEKQEWSDPTSWSVRRDLAVFWESAGPALYKYSVAFTDLFQIHRIVPAVNSQTLLELQ